MDDSDGSYCILSDSEEESDDSRAFFEEPTNGKSGQQRSYTVISPVKLHEMQVKQATTTCTCTY